MSTPWMNMLEEKDGHRVNVPKQEPQQASNVVKSSPNVQDSQEKSFAQGGWQASKEERILCRENKLTLQEHQFVSQRHGMSVFYKLKNELPNWTLRYSPFTKFNFTFLGAPAPQGTLRDSTYAKADSNGLDSILQSVAQALINGKFSLNIII